MSYGMDEVSVNRFGMNGGITLERNHVSYIFTIAGSGSVIKSFNLEFLHSRFVRRLHGAEQTCVPHVQHLFISFFIYYYIIYF